MNVAAPSSRDFSPYIAQKTLWGEYEEHVFSKLKFDALLPLELIVRPLYAVALTVATIFSFALLPFIALVQAVRVIRDALSETPLFEPSSTASSSESSPPSSPRSTLFPGEVFIARDGDCLFNAVLHGLKKKGKAENAQARNLRNQVVNHIISHQAQYRSDLRENFKDIANLGDEIDKDYDRALPIYLTHMRNNSTFPFAAPLIGRMRTYGGKAELRALSEIYNVNIHTYQNFNGKLTHIVSNPIEPIAERPTISIIRDPREPGHYNAYNPPSSGSSSADEGDSR